MFHSIPTYSAVFIAGFLAFFSPCILPIVPAYLLYLAGLTLKDYSSGDRMKLFANALLFVLGFSFIFVLFGAAASALGSILFGFRDLIRIIGGIIIILLSLVMLGVFKSETLARTIRFNLKSKPTSLSGSFIVGITFGAAWTPCVGPILGAVLVLAGTSSSVLQGSLLLTVFSIGLAIPFLAVSQLLGWATGFIKAIEKYSETISKVSAILLLIIGMLVLTNNLSWLSFAIN